MLQGLIADNDALEAEHDALRKRCAAELSEMQSRAEALAAGEGDVADDPEVTRALELYSAEAAKEMEIRRLLGQKGRESAALQRRLDETPARAELMQYERRFRELFQQVANKLEETKKYYALFNRYDEQKGYISKEISLVDSIHDAFTKPGAQRAKLVASMEGIVKSVEGSLAKADGRLAAELDTQRALSSRHEALVERQRQYFRLVKEFQLEGQRAERLAA